MFRAIIYDADGRDRDIAPGDVDLAALTDRQLIWAYGDFSGGTGAGLPDAITDAFRTMADDQASFARFETYYQVRLPQLAGDAPLMLAAGAGWMATMSDQLPDFIDDYVEQDRGESLKGVLTPDTLLAVMVGLHFDALQDAVATIDAAIDKLDVDVLAARQRKYTLEMLAVLRRRVSRLRATIAGQRHAVHAIGRADFTAALSPEDARRFERLTTSHARLEDDVNRARETVVGSFELFAARVSHDTNALIKALTIVTVITGFVGGIAGVFGMNTGVPLEHSGLRGFLIVIGGIVALSATTIALGFWRKWF